jgi:hypothetical protein
VAYSAVIKPTMAAEEDFPEDVDRLTYQRCGESVEVSQRLVICRRCGNQIRPRAESAKGFVLDSNVYDQLVATPQRQRLFIDACESGLTEFLMTHIQRDELMNHPNETTRNAIFGIPFVVAMTSGVVLGTSKFGFARFGEPGRVHAIRSPSGNHTHDALIATTAEAEGAVLVTEERRLRNQARRQNIEVWTAAELIEYVENLAEGGP